MTIVIEDISVNVWVAYRVIMEHNSVWATRHVGTTWASNQIIGFDSASLWASIGIDRVLWCNRGAEKVGVSLQKSGSARGDDWLSSVGTLWFTKSESIDLNSNETPLWMWIETDAPGRGGTVVESSKSSTRRLSLIQLGFVPRRERQNTKPWKREPPQKSKQVFKWSPSGSVFKS